MSLLAPLADAVALAGCLRFPIEARRRVRRIVERQPGSRGPCGITTLRTNRQTQGGDVFEIRQDDLTGEQTRGLLVLHLAGMRASSPTDGVFALEPSGLQAPGVTVWTAWRGGRAASVGALKMLPFGDAEVKSMRTHPDFIRQGAAAAILETIIAAAAAGGARRLMLETGSGPTFEPALSLYRRRGFENGAAFGDYTQSDFNQFLHLDLAKRGSAPMRGDGRGGADFSR